MEKQEDKQRAQIVSSEVKQPLQRSSAMNQQADEFSLQVPNDAYSSS